MVILPARVHDEVRNLPENQVSFQKEIAALFMAKHTGIGKDRPETIKAVNLVLLLPTPSHLLTMV